MKRIVLYSLILTMALFAIVVRPFAVQAYTDPVQTGNVTDVIVWYGDNLTIDNLDDGAQVIADSIDSAADDYLALLIFAFIILIVLWQKSIFLFAVSSIPVLSYGLSVSVNNTVYSPLWLAGVAIALTGTYFIYRINSIGLKWGGSKVK